MQPTQGAAEELQPSSLERKHLQWKLWVCQRCVMEEQTGKSYKMKNELFLEMDLHTVYRSGPI